MKILRLKKREARRVRAGHLWIFSNEVDVSATPLSGFEPGDPVRVEDASGRFVAQAYVNPGSLIAARVVSRKPSRPLTADLVRDRLTVAHALRVKLFRTPFYRLLFAEGDFLPGLIVDRFHDVFVVQSTTAGIERIVDQVVEVIDDMFRPKAVVLKNDSSSRVYEGLESYVRTALGEAPESLAVEQDGMTFYAPLSTGQKTGWYFDQRANRRLFAAHAAGARVLDIFSYVGAAALLALNAGAREAVCVDASKLALDHAARSASQAGLASRLETLAGDAAAMMEQLRKDGRRFDLIHLDPPSFIKHKKDKRKGSAAYARINREALKLLEEGGLLMSCSCSQHFSPEDLRVALQKAAVQRKVRLQILTQGHQAEDHPVHPAMPETSYLKTALVRMTK